MSNWEFAKHLARMAMKDEWRYVFRQLSSSVVDWTEWPRVVRERHDAVDRIERERVS